ncbi:MAG TPA: thioesterase family protein [Bacteroidales bacterium]|nr:thioesterase family protein [Bacteroidales bacterium]HQH18014.1 thioesterase family protein [Bacteroidales bacterium]HQI46761.1 thioesterase family protein [Bacteroidales bacterium]
MEINIPQNVKHKLEIKVSIKDTAIQYGSGLIEVFATPAMIGLMEGTAQQSIQQYLPEGAITLGIEINAKHIKATPVGMTVYCESTLIKTDGKKLFFELIAFDEKGEIGSATHTRYVVDAKKFMEKINT